MNNTRSRNIACVISDHSLTREQWDSLKAAGFVRVAYITPPAQRRDEKGLRFLSGREIWQSCLRLAPGVPGLIICVLSTALIGELVRIAHKHDVPVVRALGGWGEQGYVWSGDWEECVGVELVTREWTPEKAVRL